MNSCTEGYKQERTERRLDFKITAPKNSKIPAMHPYEITEWNYVVILKMAQLEKREENKVILLYYLFFNPKP